MGLFKYCLILLNGLYIVAAQASSQDVTVLKKSIEQYLIQQTAKIPGEVSFTIGAIDSRLNLKACPKLELFTPSGHRVWGNTTVGVRCESAWTIYVPVAIKVIGDVVTAARPLASGDVLTANDLKIIRTDLTTLPPNVLTATEQAVGKTSASHLQAGQTLRSDMLKVAQIIKTGQIVKVVAQGQGFAVNADGKALGSAGVGQTVTVRTPSGQILSGVVKPNGTVEVVF